MAKNWQEMVNRKKRFPWLMVNRMVQSEYLTPYPEYCLKNKLQSIYWSYKFYEYCGNPNISQ